MQEIRAYVRANMLDKVLDHLALISGLSGVAVLKAQNYGRVIGTEGFTRTKMMKIEVDAPSELVAEVVDTIVRNARTKEGHPGDGKIVVLPVSSIRRIAE